MLALIALAYLLLCVRVRICTEISVSGAEGSLMLSAGAAGIYLRYDAMIRRKKKGLSFRLTPLYGRPSKAKKEESGRSMHIARTYLWFARTGRMEFLLLDARIGLEDAYETALAAGCLRALGSALFLHAGGKAVRDLNITPDFGRECFQAHVCCIFSCQGGDIMFAAVRAAVRKRGKEGFKWKSIPLRA